ncbi:MAG TPA: hypothetical protein VG389_15790 [Myxococcota bacterium]|nr:hypothetical protein [Myxococcota bacterium]
MSKLTKSSLHERWPVCVRALHRRPMPLTHFDGLLWAMGEPQPWGEPPSLMPAIVVNDFILGPQPLHFRSNREASGEGYLLAPSADTGLKEPFGVVVEQTGLELWTAPKDLERGAVRALLERVERFHNDTLHDWALLRGVAVRRPAWEVTLGDQFPRKEWFDLAQRLAGAWKDIDRDPDKLGAAAKLPPEVATLVAARGVLEQREGG